MSRKYGTGRVAPKVQVGFYISASMLIEVNRLCKTLGISKNSFYEHCLMTMILEKEQLNVVKSSGWWPDTSKL